MKIADAQVLIEQLPTQEKALQLTRERYGTLENRIGAGQSVARILEMLSQQAKERRLELVAVQPRAQKSEQHMLSLGPEMTLRETPLSIQLTGRYRSLGEFLGALTHASFVASVQKVTVTKSETTSEQLRAEVLLTMYLSEQRVVP